MAAVIAISTIAAPARAESPTVPADDALPTTPPPPPPPPPGALTGRVVVWPTLTPAGDEASKEPLHKPKATELDVYARAQELDATLRDAMQDFGLDLDVADLGPAADKMRDIDLLERAARSGKRGAAEEGEWVISARIQPDGTDTFMLRIVAVPPKSKSLRVRVERVRSPDIAVRGLVMVRDLLSVAPPPSPEDRPENSQSIGYGVMSKLKSPGRAVLALNGALFGAYVSYSISRAGGSEDPRLLYPLLAIGTGTGLGAALLGAEEFDVTTGDAWYLAGGAWWGTSSFFLLANSQHIQPVDDRYAWGVGGGVGGLGLGIIGLTRKRMDEGGATLTHSGGALGLLLGSLADLAYRGDLSAAPNFGAGLGSAVGLVSMGTTALFVDVTTQRTLLIDLGAGLGALAGSAAGSPFIVNDVASGDLVSTQKTRAFLGLTAAGTIAGGAIGYALTREKSKAKPEPGAPAPAPPKPAAFQLLPMTGVIGQSATREGPVPAYGIGVMGTF